MFEAFWRWLLPRVVVWLSLPLRVISREDGAPYLYRWYLFGEPGGHKYFPADQPMRWWQKALTWLPCVYVHRFVSSDSDPELHNHPWTATSWILVGGYIEERRVPALQGIGYRVIIQTFRPGMLNHLAADTFHRVLLAESDAWSLIRIGEKVQTWGFFNMETGIFLHWKEHAARKAMWRAQRKQKRASS